MRRRSRSINCFINPRENSQTSSGLPRRPWFVHQIYAPGFYTGYGVKTIPGVREAIEEKQWDEVEPQIKNASAAIQALSSQIESATRMLEGR